MLRTLLIAISLLAASGSAIAHSDYGYGRVVAVEPRVSVSFGSGYHDGFRVLYESGGQRYWTYSQHHPGHVIVLPPRHRVKHVHHYREHNRGWDDRRYQHGWDDRQDRRHDRRDDRRDHRRHDRY